MWVKICGTTSEEDGLLAVAMGADAIGFTFAPSPRQVPAAVAADIVKRLPPEIITIGVFRDASPESVVRTVNEVGLKGVQLHGHETIVETQWVRERVPLVIKAFAAGNPAIADIKLYGADAVLVDNVSPGSGELFDWSLADGVPTGTKLVMAGGLTAENVVDAIIRVRPWGVDVATGVEASPGRKDPRKLRAFVAAAKGTKPAESRVRDDDDDDGPYNWQDEE